MYWTSFCHFQTKCTGHRSVIFFKTYLGVFVCMTTRSVHLETMSGLETEDFLHSFNRFQACRGPPSKIFSDNGPNFIKARKSINIDRTLGPPYGSHHQGLVEAAVKSSKRCLFKVTKGHVLTFEEYCTLFARIEATLNSRPLCRYDGGYLTPEHFLIGKHLLLPSEPDVTSIPLHQRYHLVDKMYRDFWLSWSRDYLNDFNNRTRWMKKKPNVEVGDIVLVSQPDTKSHSWPLAKITRVYPESDQLVRKVTVQISGQEYDRPITRLVLLPIDTT